MYLLFIAVSFVIMVTYFIHKDTWRNYMFREVQQEVDGSTESPQEHYDRVLLGHDHPKWGGPNRDGQCPLRKDCQWVLGRLRCHTNRP